MLKAVVVSIIEAPTPRPTLGLPTFPQRLVNLRTVKEFPIPEEVEVYRKPDLMAGFWVAVPHLYTYSPMNTGIAEGITFCNLKAHFVSLV
jgi:hypothetical protein